MENNASKRKADEELKKDAEKKNRSATTPRTTRSNPNTAMASSEEARGGPVPDQSTISLILDLKNHMSEVTRESTSKWSSLVDQVNGKVEKNTADISEIKKSIERIERTQAELAASPAPTPGEPIRIFTGQRAKYDFARRSLRLWPIKGTCDQEIKAEAIRFIRVRLLVEQAICQDDQIERVRRTRQPRRAKGRVNNEVLITFTDKFARDGVAAGARNLADYKDESGEPTAGLRVNYPDHLGSDFRALEWYGAEMRRIHGEGTRRSIKFDDELEALCIDIKVPFEEEWHRINPDTAKEFKRKVQGSSVERSRAVLEVRAPRISLSSRSPLSGANSIPLLTPPVLSTSALLSGQTTTPSNSADQIGQSSLQRGGQSRTSTTSYQQGSQARSQSLQTPPLVVHNPDEVIYITPKKRIP